MEAIILAGGLGTRLREAVPDLPKPMAPINGKPFLEYLIRNLKNKGFTRVILAVGYMANKIEEYFGDSYDGVEIAYSREIEPLGTGGAIRLAIERCHDDHVYVFNGDTYLDIEVMQVEELWNKFNCSIIVTKFMSDASRYGLIVHSGINIVGFKEKTSESHGLINAGCYILRRNDFSSMRLLENFSIEKDYFESRVGALQILMFETKGFFIDIGIPSSYVDAAKYLKF